MQSIGDADSGVAPVVRFLCLGHDVLLELCPRTGSRAEASPVFCWQEKACLFSVFLTGTIFLHGRHEHELLPCL